MSESEIHVKSSAAAPRTKPAPDTSAIKVPFVYTPSDDGTDANLLILLHGLGDTHTPFGKLGKTLKLPQTATLAIQAPQQIPFFDEPAFQWYPSFDPLGELISNPNPTVALDLLAEILAHLTTVCQWRPEEIHLFGFAQGGSVAAEACLKWWRTQAGSITADDSDSNSSIFTPRPLGSAITIGGPLISYPTLKPLCQTPIFLFGRTPPGSPAFTTSDLSTFRKGFSMVKDVKMSGEGMPRSKDEWHPIMEFWSQRLSRRVGEGLYEIMSGMGPS